MILYNKSTFVFQVCLLVNKATDVYTALREREQTNYPTSKAWQRRVKGKKKSRRKNPEKSRAHNITSFRVSEEWAQWGQSLSWVKFGFLVTTFSPHILHNFHGIKVWKFLIFIGELHKYLVKFQIPLQNHKFFGLIVFKVRDLCSERVDFYSF